VIPFVAAAVAVAGCGGDSPAGQVVDSPADSETSYLDDRCVRSGAERLKLFHITDEGFKPQRVVVRTGTPVRFVNCGDEPHTVTKVAGRGPKFDSGTLESREFFDRTFADIGTQRLVDERTGNEMIVDVRGLPGQPQN
jgi:plastocyanin